MNTPRPLGGVFFWARRLCGFHAPDRHLNLYELCAGACAKMRTARAERSPFFSTISAQSAHHACAPRYGVGRACVYTV